jgi:hypothetical protein
MKNESKHSNAKLHAPALIASIVFHAALGIFSMLVLLSDPEKVDNRGPIILELEATVEQFTTPLKPLPKANTQDAIPKPRTAAGPAIPAPIITQEAKEIELTDLVILDSSKSSFQHRISSKLLEEMSQEEAFDELMGLLEEYPEYKETILGKMLAGKDMQHIPDLYVSTGLERLQKQMKFKTKHEYEAMRQQFLYGPYNDPVLGPHGYQKTGVQINLIELLGWLRGLIEGK